MLQTARGTSVTILDDGKPGPVHFLAQIKYIYGIKEDDAALEALKDGCVVLPEWTEVARTSVA